MDPKQIREILIYEALIHDGGDGDGGRNYFTGGD